MYSDCNTVLIDLLTEIGILSFKEGLGKLNQRISQFSLFHTNKTRDFYMLLHFSASEISQLNCNRKFLSYKKMMKLVI